MVTVVGPAGGVTLRMSYARPERSQHKASLSDLRLEGQAVWTITKERRPHFQRPGVKCQARLVQAVSVAPPLSQLLNATPSSAMYDGGGGGGVGSRITSSARFQSHHQRRSPIVPRRWDGWEDGQTN